MKKFLVPLDGSEFSQCVLPLVAHMARRLGASITLLCVIDPDAVDVQRITGWNGSSTDITMGGAAPETLRARPVFSKDPPRNPHASGAVVRPYASQVFEGVQGAVKEWFAKETRRLGIEDIATSRVEFGKIEETIVKVAEREGFDLIAMTTHGRTPLGRGIWGSVADKVIRTSSVPVLAVKSDDDPAKMPEDVTMRTVIVPLDGSDLAEQVLPQIEWLARSLALKVLLVRAVDMGAFVMPTNGYHFISTISLDEVLGKEAEEYLEGVANRLRSKGLDIAWRVVWGNAARAIVDFARETDADMVAMATHARSGLPRLIIGSVSEKVVRSSGEPVLIVPPLQQAA
ncbi:MAG: universal stress protein [Chloroflexi bacterium]|nr:universal stress protein [Chloroflexota bacterium]